MMHGQQNIKLIIRVTIYVKTSILPTAGLCVSMMVGYRDKRVPVTTEWRVLRLRMEERPPIWRVAANILNKQSRTADKGWSSSLGVGRGAENSST
jgi:hypothetical protein